MKTQETKLNNGERFEIVNSSIPVTQELTRSAINISEMSQHMKTLEYETITDTNRNRHIASLPCVPPHGYITLTCPTTEVAAGESFTISISVTNDSSPGATGLYVIGISVAPFSSLTTLLAPLIPTAFPSGGNTTQSPIITLGTLATSMSYSWTYTMPTPAAPISVVCDLSSTCP